MRPSGWKLAHLPLECQVEMNGLETKKRPLKAFADGKLISEHAVSMKVFFRGKLINLAFLSDYDIGQKMVDDQFV